MRIAIVGDYPLDETRIWGGEQAAFTYLVRALCQIDGVQVHVLTLGGKDLAGQVRRLPSGATLHVLPPFPRMELYRRFATYQSHLNNKLAEIGADVVHAQGAIHHGYVALGSGRPAVITVHGVQSEDSKHQSSFYLRLRKWLVSRLVERYNLSHTRHLIAISRYVTSYFSQLLRSDIDVHYIPNAIDSNFFKLEDQAGGNTVLFAGRVIQRKRVLDLVQAFAQVAEQCPTAQLRIAGEYQSEKEYSEAIRTFIKSAKLEQRVHLLGPLGEADVLQEFARCDVLALPSAQETTPMVIAQAMAAAKPVVATPVGGVAEMVNDGQTGFLIDLGDITGQAKALTQILQNPALRTQMGNAGHQFAIENYRADSVARRTYEVYQNMIA